ncbi:MAG: ABC transporter substrate-binding protein [Spirochaetia bacterium]|jgi:putative ABC transport system substrate-binding protein|nr:ABC transporter substrate-binding protein [Spirochaetia bacterium]
MKRIIAMALAIMTISQIAFAQGNPELSSKVQQSTAKPLKIGISKLVSHPALDAIEKGIQDYLNDNGYSADFDLENANGEISTAIQIAQTFKNKGEDMVIGIATPPAQALATVYQDSKVPVIYAAITDPVAAGLTFPAGTDTNVCGVSDLNPIDLQIKTFVEVTGLKKLGMIYTSGEANGVAMEERAAKYCKENGIEFITAAVANSAEVKTAALSIIHRVDGMFIANDNTVVSALASVDQVCKEAGVPLFNSDITSSYGTDFLMSWGLDYYKVGLVSGQVAAKVIDGEKPSDIGAIYLTDIKQFKLMLNLDRAKELGITFPKNVREAASILVENGKEVEL